MSRVVYPLALEAMWGGGAGAVGATVKVVAVDTTVYTYSDAHEFLSDLAGIVSAAVTLTSKDFTGGIFTAAAVLITGVTSAEEFGAIVTYVDTGVAGTSRLLTYDDENADSTTIDVVGNDLAVLCSWPHYVGRI